MTERKRGRDRETERERERERQRFTKNGKRQKKEGMVKKNRKRK